METRMQDKTSWAKLVLLSASLLIPGQLDSINAHYSIPYIITID